MPRVVRICATAPNLTEMPPPQPGVEVWLANWHKGYNRKLPRLLGEWTRYFNLHSRRHMNATYPHGVRWYKSQDGTRPIYFQKHQPDIPGSTPFPREAVEQHFGHSYFTFSGAWMAAFAIMEGFERIEFWGFMLRDKPDRHNECYKFERPCFFYWVQEARNRGIEVIYQQEIADLPFEPGDPHTYTGTVYGFETKPED